MAVVELGAGDYLVREIGGDIVVYIPSDKPGYLHEVIRATAGGRFGRQAHVYPPLGQRTIDGSELTSAGVFGGKRTPRKAYAILSKILADLGHPPPKRILSYASRGDMTQDQTEVPKKEKPATGPRRVGDLTEYRSPYVPGQMVPFESLAYGEGEAEMDTPEEVYNDPRLFKKNVTRYVHEYDGPSYPYQVDVLVGPKDLLTALRTNIYHRYQPGLERREMSGAVKFLLSKLAPNVTWSVNFDRGTAASWMRASGTGGTPEEQKAALTALGFPYGSAKQYDLHAPIRLLPALDAHVGVQGAGPARPVGGAGGTGAPRAERPPREGQESWPSPTYGAVKVTPGPEWSNLGARTGRRKDGSTGTVSYGYSVSQSRWARGDKPPQDLLDEAVAHGFGALFGLGEPEPEDEPEDDEPGVDIIEVFLPWLERENPDLYHAVITRPEIRALVDEVIAGVVVERLFVGGAALIGVDLLLPDPVPSVPGPITAGVLSMGASRGSGQLVGLQEGMSTDREARAAARRQRQWTTRVGALHDQEGSDRFDADFWAGVTPAERTLAAWQMVEDAAAIRGWDETQLRLQRSTERIVRR